MNYHARRMQNAIQEMRAARAYEGKEVTQLSKNGWTTIGQGLNIQPSEVFGSGWNAATLSQVYSKSALVNACVKEKATSISEARLMLGTETEEGFEEVESHEALDLFYKNELYNYQDIIEMMVTRMDLTGVTYQVLDSYSNRLGYGGMVPVPTHLVKEITNGPFVQGYEVTTSGDPIKFEPQEVMSVGYLDPTSYRSYTSPLAAAIREIKIDEERQTLTQETMVNRQMPGTILVPSHNLNANQSKALTASINAATGGDNHNRGKALVTPFGIDIKEGFNLKDIDFEKLNLLTETRICAVFGVSPIIIAVASGLLNSTYANYEQASIATYRETYIPLWRKLEAAFTRKLLLNTGENLTFKFDLSEIAELQEDANERAARAGQLFKDKLWTKNEARTLTGVDPVEDGDEFGKDPAPVMPFGGGETEEQETPETEGKEAALPKAPAEFRPPEQVLLEATLIREFKKQEAEAIAMLKKSGSVDVENIGSTLGQAIEDTLLEIAQESASKTLRKFVGKSADKFEGKATEAELATAFNVVNPELVKVIRAQAIQLSEATLAKTAEDITSTMTALRTELVAAQVTGPNTVPALVEGVKRVFKSAEDFRARRIAVTESSRAVHSAEILSGEASGVVQGWSLMPSPDACELCQVYSEDNKPTGEPLYPYTDGKSAISQLGSYDNRTLAPIHPNCRCTNVPVLVDEAPPAASGTVNEQLGKRPKETPRRRPGGRPDPQKPLQQAVQEAVKDVQ